MAKVIDSESVIKKEAVRVFEKVVEGNKGYAHIIPPGYLPLTLSSEGSFGVPKKIWLKNFSTEDTLHLSMASEDMLPDFLVSVLNKNIWNPENTINVANWTEMYLKKILLTYVKRVRMKY